MDLIDVFRACFRRWYFVLPVLLVTGWVAHNFYSSVKPEYYSNSVIGIAPSNLQVQYRDDGLAIARNGLLDVGGPNLLMTLAVLGFNDPSVRTQVAAAGGKPDFGVRMFPSPVTGNGPGEQLPLIMIEANAADAASAQKTVELATAQADGVLVNLQRESQVPDDQMVHALIASPPAQAIAGIPSRTKSTLYIGMVGLAIALLIGLVADVLIGRLHISRRPHSEDKRQGPDSSGPPEPNGLHERNGQREPNGRREPNGHAERSVFAHSEPSRWFDDTYKRSISSELRD